jgi:hypothetical protein
MDNFILQPRFTSDAKVEKSSNGWRLQIPPGNKGKYSLAQLDNYARLSRNKFPVTRSAILSLKCRVSASSLPGTWGFGFWNDPFAVSFGLNGGIRRIPALPNAAWFFHASSENYITFTNDLPGNGFLTQIYQAPRIPSLLLTPGILGSPFLLYRPASRLLRRIASKLISQKSQSVELDVTEWHTYSLSIINQSTLFSIENKIIFQSDLFPHCPLGVVIWIDNQYASWTPDGKLGFGTISNNTSNWLEIKDIELSF